MKLSKINWPIWTGFLMSVIAFVSYPLVFVIFPVTRDFPWANLLLFALAGFLLFVGIRRAFASDRPRRSKIAGSIVTVLSAAIFGFFIFAVFIFARNLPAAHSAPQLGQKAPEFTLTDTNGKSVSLAELLTTPVKGGPPKGVLLVFYRGYW
jgi:hypothetical protein